MDVERSNSFLSFSALMVELKKSTWKIHFCSLEKCHIKNVTWLCHMVMWHEQLYVENGWSFKILVKMDHKWISFGRFGPNFWLLADLLAFVGSYRTSEITKRTIPCSFLVSSCLKSLHSQTPNPFIPLGNMYSLFCGWRINTGGQRDETVYGKINCFFITDEPFLTILFVFRNEISKTRTRTNGFGPEVWSMQCPAKQSSCSVVWCQLEVLA